MTTLYRVWDAYPHDDECSGEFHHFADVARAREFAQGLADFYREDQEVCPVPLRSDLSPAVLAERLLAGCAFTREEPVAVEIVEPRSVTALRRPVLQCGGDGVSIVYMNQAEIDEMLTPWEAVAEIAKQLVERGMEPV